MDEHDQLQALEDRINSNPELVKKFAHLQYLIVTKAIKVEKDIEDVVMSLLLENNE